MRYFLQLRNISQKQGPIRIVGGMLSNRSWTYRFVGERSHAVPEELTGRDIGACCAEHLAKLASLLLACVHTFPFHSCPGKAFTEEGMAALGYSWDDAEEAIGLPSGWTDVDNIPAKERLRILSREISPLELESIERIANGDLRGKNGPLKFPTHTSTDLFDHFLRHFTASLAPKKR